VSSRSPKGCRRSCEDKVFFRENAKSRGHNSFKNNRTGFPLQYAHLHIVIFLCTKCHQDPPKDVGGVAKTKYFSEKMLSPGAITLSKIIGQGSPYNMHIYTL
jgi:hypothetical protein